MAQDNKVEGQHHNRRPPPHPIGCACTRSRGSGTIGPIQGMRRRWFGLKITPEIVIHRSFSQNTGKEGRTRYLATPGASCTDSVELVKLFELLEIVHIDDFSNKPTFSLIIRWRQPRLSAMSQCLICVSQRLSAVSVGKHSERSAFGTEDAGQNTHEIIMFRSILMRQIHFDTWLKTTQRDPCDARIP